MTRKQNAFAADEIVEMNVQTKFEHHLYLKGYESVGITQISDPKSQNFESSERRVEIKKMSLLLLVLKSALQI